MEKVCRLEVCLCVWVYGGGPVGGHVICAQHLVELLGCVYVASREAEVSHDLEKGYVVHASECSLEVGVDCVYACFDLLASSDNMI